MWNTQKDYSKEHTAERQPLQRQAAGVYNFFGCPPQCHGSTLLVQSCMHSLYRDVLSAGPKLIRAYHCDIYKIKSNILLSFYGCRSRINWAR